MLGIALVLLWVLTWAPPVHAECVVDTDSPTFINGKRVDTRCDERGQLKTVVTAATAKSLTVASGVTTNTTTTPVAGVSGDKTYWARVVGTGAVTATVEFLGCHSTTVSAAECVSLGTIVLSGTTSKYDVPTPAVGAANYPYMAVTTTNVTGTGATVSAGVHY